MIDQPSSIEHHVGLGRHLITAHSYEGAIEHFRAALSLDPDHAMAHALLALALAQVGRLPAAEHEADLALQLDPDEPFFFYIKGVVLAGAQKWKPAQQMLEQAIAADPYEASYHAHLGQVLYHQDRYREAEAATRHALDLDPEDDFAHLYLGYALLDLKRRDEARHHLEQALRLDPEDSDTHNGMGVYYLQGNDPERALHHIHEALRLDPNNSYAQHNLVLAMGAKNWFYGLFWKWSLFLTHFSSGVQIAIIIGLWAFMQMLRAVARAYPAAAPAVAVIGFLYFFFCIYTWTAPAIFRWWLRRSQPF
jgi:Flp pilus assembly protein TadD